jgi:hypothetical protein
MKWKKTKRDFISFLFHRDQNIHLHLEKRWLFCWYWWNCWPSLTKLSFWYGIAAKILRVFSMFRRCLVYNVEMWILKFLIDIRQTLGKDHLTFTLPFSKLNGRSLSIHSHVLDSIAPPQHHDIAEILLKLALNTNQSTSPSVANVFNSITKFLMYWCYHLWTQMDKFENQGILFWSCLIKQMWSHLNSCCIISRT